MSLSRYLPCYQVVFRQHPGNDEACILSVHILCFPAPELLTPASQGGEGEGLMVCCYAVDCSISGLADTASHLHSQKWLWMMAGGWLSFCKYLELISSASLPPQLEQHNI